jgi:hypothetical protein
MKTLKIEYRPMGDFVHAARTIYLVQTDFKTVVCVRHEVMVNLSACIKIKRYLLANDIHEVLDFALKSHFVVVSHWVKEE